MRLFQVILFILGLLVFASAALFIGSEYGEILWEVGMGAMLTDVVCIMLWPTGKK